MKAKIKKMATDVKGVIDYHEITREYSFPLLDTTHQLIQFCPWCGTKLPKDLNDEWEEIVAKEFGVTQLYYRYMDKIPPEFKTDEWWKKRGL
jgi:hypothetical protein